MRSRRLDLIYSEPPALIERFERHDERLSEIEKALALIVGRTGYVNFMGLLAGMSILVSIALVVAEIVRWR